MIWYLLHENCSEILPSKSDRPKPDSKSFFAEEGWDVLSDVTATDADALAGLARPSILIELAMLPVRRGAQRRGAPALLGACDDHHDARSDTRSENEHEHDDAATGRLARTRSFPDGANHHVSDMQPILLRADDRHIDLAHDRGPEQPDLSKGGGGRLLCA